jgi:hypothetical protein
MQHGALGSTEGQTDLNHLLLSLNGVPEKRAPPFKLESDRSEPKSCWFDTQNGITTDVCFCTFQRRGNGQRHIIFVNNKYL